MEPKAKRRKLLSLNRSRAVAVEPTSKGTAPSAHAAGASVPGNVSLRVDDERKLPSIATISDSSASCVLRDSPVNAAVSASHVAARQPSTCTDLTDGSTYVPSQRSPQLARSRQPTSHAARPRVSSEQQDFDDFIRDGFGISTVSRSAAKPAHNKNGGLSQTSQPHKKPKPLPVRAPVTLEKQNLPANVQPHTVYTTKPARTLFRGASQESVPQPPGRVASYSSRHPKAPRGADACGSQDETCSNTTEGEPNREPTPLLNVKPNLSTGAAAAAAGNHTHGNVRADDAQAPAVSAPQTVQHSQQGGDQPSQCVGSFSARRRSAGLAASSPGMLISWVVGLGGQR